MRACLRVAGLVGAALIIGAPPAARAQAGGGTLQLTVTDERTDAPLAYAVLVIPKLDIERFTDARGRLTVPSLAPGVHDIVVRRLGFTPYRAPVTIAAGTPSVLNVRLTRIPQRLADVRVRAETPCTSPGAPDEARDREVFTLVSLLRENADRYRLLASRYPFESVLQRALGDMKPTALLVQSVDVTIAPSRTQAGYRAGQVVRRRGGQYTMALPTILDLADDRFAASHCFSYGGASVHTTSSVTETWFRLDVRASDALRDPDVHGVFYLDSATAQLRSMDLELSRADRLPKQLSAIASVHVSTEFLEIASGLSVIRKICAVTRLRSPAGGVARNPNALPPVVPTELQQLISYRFTTPPPDVEATQRFDGPGWQAATYTAREAVWCERSGEG